MVPALLCQTCPTNKKATSFPNGRSVGKFGACRKQREHQQQIHFEPLSSAVPPTVSVLSQARSLGGRLSKWVPPPRLLLSQCSKLQQAHRATLQSAGSSPPWAQSLPSRFESRCKNMLASDSPRRNCKGHVNSSRYPVMEWIPLRWFCWHVLP